MHATIRLKLTMKTEGTACDVYFRKSKIVSFGFDTKKYELVNQSVGSMKFDQKLKVLKKTCLKILTQSRA